MRHPIRHASPLHECLGTGKLRILKIHIRFHETLDFNEFLQVLQPFRVVSQASNDISIVPGVFGLQLVRKDETCRYPEDPNFDIFSDNTTYFGRFGGFSLFLAPKNVFFMYLTYKSGLF